MCRCGDDLMARGWWWWWRWWVSWIVDQDEFAEVELVGESFPFGLVQDAFVVVISGSQMFSVSDYTLTGSTGLDSKSMGCPNGMCYYVYVSAGI